MPPGPQQLGALVTHAVAHRDGPVGEVLAELLGVTQVGWGVKGWGKWSACNKKYG